MNIKHTFWLILLMALTEVKAQTVEANKTIPVLTFDELEPLLKTQSDSVFIINFWATWCAPCVKELPHFERLHSDMADKKVKVILISLDFKNQIEKQLYSFIKKNNIQSEVIVLADKKMDVWIPKVSRNWQGSIPATFVFNKTEKLFAEREFATYEDLIQHLKPFLNL